MNEKSCDWSIGSVTTAWRKQCLLPYVALASTCISTYQKLYTFLVPCQTWKNAHLYIGYLNRRWVIVWANCRLESRDNSSSWFALTADYSLATHTADYKIWWNNVDQAWKEKDLFYALGGIYMLGIPLIRLM